MEDYMSLTPQDGPSSGDASERSLSRRGLLGASGALLAGSLLPGVGVAAAGEGGAPDVACEEITPGQPEQISTAPDAFLLKVDAEGRRQWAGTYSAPGPEYASADAAVVVQRPGGGYAFVGTQSAGQSTPFWIVGTDADGERVWDLTAGGRQYNSPFSMIRTADGGYAVVGITTGEHPAEPDVRLVGLTADR